MPIKSTGQIEKGRQYIKLTKEYYDGIEKIRVDLSKLNISSERMVEEFSKRKREFTTNLRRKYVDEYGSKAE